MPVQVKLNDVVFTQYHRFKPEMRILATAKVD